jgi:glycosyltransferase involved in cell wall biosynthesis
MWTASRCWCRVLKIDILARAWGGPAGASNGMAQAAAFLAETLAELGHQVRRLQQPDGFGADLVISTIQPRWRHAVTAATAAGALERLVYWHHAGGLPDGQGCTLAAPPAIAPEPGWARHVVLPPSSWAAEAGGERTGGEILVAGAAIPKGGHVALEVARLCPDLRWYVLHGRSSQQDHAPWLAMPNAVVSEKVADPAQFLARARAVLAPTRFEVHPLLLVEAAVRGIPIVCTDMLATRCAAGGSAVYLRVTAPANEWAAALRQVLEQPLPRLRLRPYAEVVRDALVELQGRAAA